MSLLSKIQATKGKLKPTNTIITTLDGKKISNNGEVLTTGGHGFIVDTKPDKIPAEILDGLYLGSQDCVDLDVLESYQITNVFSVGINVDLSLPSNIKREFFECLDLPETNISEILTKICPMIDSILKNNEKVLVHCNAGVSRSSTIIIGYLILYKNMNFNDAILRVKTKRECIRPNDGFMRQLKDLEKKKIYK